MKVKKAKSLARILFTRDCQLTYRHSGDYLLPIGFWILIISFFPMTNSAKPELLQLIAPGILWIGLLLTQLLNLPKLFREDYQDGILAELVQSPHDFLSITQLKLFNFWVIHYLPIFLIAPLLASMLHLSAPAIKTLELSLLLGSPTLVLFCGLVAGLTVGVKNNTLLVNLLLLPLTVPLLIFGSAAVSDAQFNLSASGPLAWMGTILLLSLLIIPYAISASLKADFE